MIEQLTETLIKYHNEDYTSEDVVEMIEEIIDFPYTKLVEDGVIEE